MIVRKVAFKKTIGMPNYSNDIPIVVEADLEPGETKEQAWTKINQDMIEWHKKEYPHLYEDAPITKVKSGPKEKTMLTLVSDINSCQEIKVLESYKLMVRADPQLQAAYDNRLKELKDGK